MKRFVLTLCLLCTVALGVAEARKVPTGLIPVPQQSFRMATVTYETGFDFLDFDAVRDSFVDLNPPSLRPWGEHPIMWKHMVRPELDLNPYSGQGYILFENVPQGIHISTGDSVLLNNYEASGAFTDQIGSVVNPSGHWVETFSTDGEEVAVLAAMAIWRWNTPVYINYYHFSDEGLSAVAVIDSVTLSTPSGVPHVVCGWSDPNASTACPGLVIESVTMSYYGEPTLCCTGSNSCCTLSYFGSSDSGVGSDEVLGSEFVSHYESFGGASNVGPVIYDPPPTLSRNGVSPAMLERASRVQAAGGVLLRNADGTVSKFK